MNEHGEFLINDGDKWEQYVLNPIDVLADDWVKTIDVPKNGMQDYTDKFGRLWPWEFVVPCSICGQPMGNPFDSCKHEKISDAEYNTLVAQYRQFGWRG